MFLRYAGPEHATLRQADGGFVVHSQDYVTLVATEDAFYEVKGDWATSTRHHYTLADLMARLAGADR